MANIAPYADIPITVSIRSVEGSRYRTLNCFECGGEFLERNGENIFRLNSKDYPEQAHVDAGGQIDALCGRCTQRYTVTISVHVERTTSQLELYMQPQSIFITSAPHKHLRDLYCYECGKAFFSISDRILSVVDDITPIGLLDPGHIGPLEPRCRFQHCKQRYQVRV